MGAGHFGPLIGYRNGPVAVGLGRWAATLVATAASTYALDLVATTAGLLLAASHVLSGLDRGWVLLFLAASYVAWGTGLWANLRANWALLQCTGTSTNALSKAAHDLAGRVTADPQWRRLATDAGYVGTELAKEAPYYVGAVGAAVFSESINAIDAMIFLGGANLGAALYEFALARGVRLFLRRRQS